MPNKNIFTVAGHLGRDAEIKNVNGKSITNFSVGVSEGPKDKRSTTWVNVTVWGELYLLKGQAVLVEGRYQDREYTAKDGNKKHDVRLIASGWNVWVPALQERSPASDGFVEE